MHAVFRRRKGEPGTVRRRPGNCFENAGFLTIMFLPPERFAVCKTAMRKRGVTALPVRSIQGYSSGMNRDVVHENCQSI